MSNQLIAIGDLHGDLDATLRILQGLSLIDDQGVWIGKNVHLVQIGDLVDRGRDSVNLVGYLSQLEQQALSAQCQLDCLIGNHELMVAEQDYRYIRPAEMLEYEHFWYQNVNGLDAIFRGSGPYAQWMRRRPVIVLADRILFVHAGVDRWAFEYTIELLNQMSSRKIECLQEGQEVPLPDPTEDILNGETGLLWHEGFRADVNHYNDWHPIQVESLIEILDHFDADMLVVGHRPTIAQDHRVVWPHPHYGREVAVVDTGICDFYNGKLSASVIDNGKLDVHYFERGERELELTDHIRQLCAEERENWKD